MPRELSEAEILALLASGRRRTTVRFLAEADTPVATSRLVERIADREARPPGADEHPSLERAMDDEHLPPLEDASVVSRDEEAGTVDVGPNFSTVLAVLESVSEEDLPWSDQ